MTIDLKKSAECWSSERWEMTHIYTSTIRSNLKTKPLVNTIANMVSRHCVHLHTPRTAQLNKGTTFIVT